MKSYHMEFEVLDCPHTSGLDGEEREAGFFVQATMGPEEGGEERGEPTWRTIDELRVWAIVDCDEAGFVYYDVSETLKNPDAWAFIEDEVSDRFSQWSFA